MARLSVKVELSFAFHMSAIRRRKQMRSHSSVATFCGWHELQVSIVFVLGVFFVGFAVFSNLDCVSREVTIQSCEHCVNINSSYHNNI